MTLSTGQARAFQKHCRYPIKLVSKKIKGLAIHWLMIHTLREISHFCSLNYDFHNLCRDGKTL